MNGFLFSTILLWTNTTENRQHSAVTRSMKSNNALNVKQNRDASILPIITHFNDLSPFQPDFHPGIALHVEEVSGFSLPSLTCIHTVNQAAMTPGLWRYLFEKRLECAALSLPLTAAPHQKDALPSAAPLSVNSGSLFWRLEQKPVSRSLILESNHPERSTHPCPRKMLWAPQLHRFASAGFPSESLMFHFMKRPLSNWWKTTYISIIKILVIIINNCDIFPL